MSASTEVLSRGGFPLTASWVKLNEWLHLRKPARVAAREIFAVPRAQRDCRFLAAIIVVSGGKCWHGRERIDVVVPGPPLKILRKVPFSRPSTIYAADGTAEIATFFDENRTRSSWTRFRT